jgi:SOS-response transcriptional repressor LexA
MAHPSFQEMLRSLLRSGMKQADIAEATGYSQSSVSRWISSKNPQKPDYEQYLAIKGLAEQKGLIQATETSLAVPLVSWVSAGAFREVGQAMPTDEFPAVEVAGLPPGDWFALRVEGDSMDRISPPDSVIFVNRLDRKLVPNACYVIANELGEATYKRYRPSPERFEPVSVNPNLEAIYPDGAINVIGRVRRSMIDF